MKKMLTLVLALVLLCMATVAMADYPKMELGIASTFVDPASDPAFNAEGLSLQYFIDLVNERSGGQITIKSYWSGMLQGDYPTMLSDGDLDLYYGYLNAAVDKRFSAFNLPGLVTDIDMGWALMGTDGEFYAKYKEIAAEYGITCMAGTAGIMRGLYNSKREVKVPGDIKDLMVRAYNDATVSAYWNGIANTVILPMSELYTSMQMGSIDGFEHGVASAISNNLQEVAKYFTNVNWQWQYMPSFMASTYLYDELDPEVIALLEECANEAAKKYYDLYKEMYEDGLKFLEESGVQVYIPTAEEQKQWDDYGYSLYEGLAKEYGCEDLINELVEISNAYKAANGK